MSNQTQPVSLEEISQRIRHAAVAESWRPGHHLSSNPPSLPASSNFHTDRIQASLRRARLKAYVRMVKPLRRIFRNQGAVNDSLIEAVSHLAAQNEELLDQILDLHELVRSLQGEKRRETPTEIDGSSPSSAEGSEQGGACA